MNAERKILSLVFATAGILSCGDASPKTEDMEPLAYSKFVINVNKTDNHGAYQVHNGIIEPANGGKEGIKNAKLKFCDHKTGAVVLVPIANTDYKERDEELLPKEKSGEISPEPFYRARKGSNPCELVNKDGIIIKAIGFPR